MFSNLKIPMGLSCLLLSATSFAALNYPCSGAPGAYHVNPNSTIGGFVASTATVDPTVIIHIEASVCERATVLEGAIIGDMSVISGKATVRGKVITGGNAKVYGESYLINTNGTELMVLDSALIYGHAFLQGSVLVEGTAEVFGWGKIIEFAQVLGHSKVCGNSIIKGSSVVQDDQSFCWQKQGKK